MAVFQPGDLVDDHLYKEMSSISGNLWCDKIYLSLDGNTETVRLTRGGAGSHGARGEDDAALCVRNLDPLCVRVIQRSDWDQSHLKAIHVLFCDHQRGHCLTCL